MLKYVKNVLYWYKNHTQLIIRGKILRVYWSLCNDQLGLEGWIWIICQFEMFSVSSGCCWLLRHSLASSYRVDIFIQARAAAEWLQQVVYWAAEACVDQLRLVQSCWSGDPCLNSVVHIRSLQIWSSLINHLCCLSLSVIFAGQVCQIRTFTLLELSQSGSFGWSICRKFVS